MEHTGDPWSRGLNFAGHRGAGAHREVMLREDSISENAQLKLKVVYRRG